MKKIMKKALSLALVVMMMLSLAPMTALAAAGDDIPNNSVGVCYDVVEVEADSTAYFEMGSYPPGEYPLIVEGTGEFTVTPCGIGADSWYSEGEISVDAVDGTATATILIQDNAWGGFAITNNTNAAVTYTCTVEVPMGTMDNPESITLSPMGPTTVKVPAGAEYYFSTSLQQIGTEYAIKVTGNTGFAYSTGRGMPIRDNNGVVETTIMQYSMQPAQFAIINNTSQEQTYTITLAMPALGTQANPDEMVFGEDVVTEIVGSEYWYSCEWVNENGMLTITVDEDACTNGWTIQTINEYTGDVIIKSSALGDNPVYEVAVESYSNFYIVVSVPENGSGTVKFSTEYEAVVVEYPLGSSENKDTLVLDEEVTVTTTSDYALYYYTFMAMEAGTLSIEMDDSKCPDGWVLSIASILDWTKEAYTESGYDTDEDEGSVTENPLSLYLEQGEMVTVWVCPGTWTAGTVTFEATFTEGTGGSTPTPDTEPELNYEKSETPIVVGLNELLLSSKDYTIYTFEPETTGKYTFTSNDSLMCLASYNGSWVTTEPSATTVTENKLTWECTGVGQSIWIAVSSETNVANITVSKEVIEDNSYETYIVDVSAPTYVFTGNVADLVYVDVEDETTDKAVYSEKDGYYHLNTVDGPILLVNLDEKLMSFVITNPNLPAPSVVVAYKDGNKISYVEDYTDAVQTYIQSSDSSTKLYPLTDELITVYKVFGEQQKWYDGEKGYVSGEFETFNPEDIWMFACQYIPNAEDGTIVVPPVVVAPEQVENGVVKDEVLEEIIKDAVAQNKPVVLPTTNPGITMTFDVEDMKDAESVSVNIKVDVVEDVKDETVAKNDKITDNNFVLKIEFSHEGKLPAKATITIAVPTEYANKTLFYYEILADGTLEYVCDAPVDENGNAKVSQDHCSDYVLLTEKLVEEVEVPGTGDATNVALWFAVLALGVAAIAGSVVMRKKEF